MHRMAYDELHTELVSEIYNHRPDARRTRRLISTLARSARTYADARRLEILLDSTFLSKRSPDPRLGEHLLEEFGARIGWTMVDWIRKEAGRPENRQDPNTAFYAERTIAFLEKIGPDPAFRRLAKRRQEREAASKRNQRPAFP